MSCSGVASGKNRQVNILQNAGLSMPQPSRIRLTARDAPRAGAASRHHSNPPERAIEHEVRDPFGVLHRVRIAIRPSLEIPRRGNRSRPAASATVSRSRTHVSKLTSGTSRCDMPLPRSS